MKNHFVLQSESPQAREAEHWGPQWLSLQTGEVDSGSTSDYLTDLIIQSRELGRPCWLMFKGVCSLWETIFGFLNCIYLSLDFSRSFHFPTWQPARWSARKSPQQIRYKLFPPSWLMQNLSISSSSHVLVFRIQLIHPILFLPFQSRPVIQDKVWMIEILNHTKVQAFAFSVTKLWTFNKNCSFTLVC